MTESGWYDASRERQRNWLDRTQFLWRFGNRLEAFQLRKLGVSPMALLNRGTGAGDRNNGSATGRRRFRPLGYWQEGDGSFIVGGGAAGKTSVPDWVANLRAIPSAVIWVRRRRIDVVACELTGDERDLAQAQASMIWPGVPRYQKMSGRIIPTSGSEKSP